MLGNKMKPNISNHAFTFLITLGMFCLFSSCNNSSQAQYSYHFKKGSILRLNYPKDFKFEFPELTISNGKSSKRFVFPLGTIIWKDKKEKGSIIVRYMDKRFSAFGSDAYALIDFINLDVITIVTDVIYEIESHNDEYLIGIQRIPKEVDYLDDFDDIDYNNSCQVLFVIKIDFKNRKFLRLNILTSSALPDNNQVFSQNESESIKSKFYVNDGILYYKKGDTIRRFILSDFNKKATHRNIKEINAQQKKSPDH